MIVMIDNYDSFTYNLVQYLEMMGHRVRVFRNDRIDAAGLHELDPEMVVISPGPGTPDRAGISLDAVLQLGPIIPLLGICLGHQCIAAAFGGRIATARRIMHGKISRILHNGKTIYRDLPNPFQATRYHSLIVKRSALPECLEVTAWTEEEEIMGLRHRHLPVEGVQFHPESILTDWGKDIIRNFLDYYLD